jgi:hypothetical protein
MSEIKCTVCGFEAKHILKGGAVQLCQKHFDQKFGKYSRGAEEGSAPVQDPMDFGEPANWTPVDGTPSLKKRKRSESGVFSAPMGYAPDGPKPFYGNRRKLIRDQWGNLRFIRRRKNGTYMDNVDFGRSIRADKQRQAKTWAPSGFRDQGDGSPNLLMRLMGAESFNMDSIDQEIKELESGDDVDGITPEYVLKLLKEIKRLNQKNEEKSAESADSDYYRDYYRLVYEIYDNNGETCYGGAYPIGGYAHASGSNMKEALESIRSELIGVMEREQRRITKAQSRNKAPRAQAKRSVAGARIVSVEQFSGFDDDGEETFVEIGADLPADIKFKSAEFESPYAGKGSLFKFGGGSDDALGGFTAKELTQSSAIHGDFDHASLNYSGHQNVAARAEDVYVHGDDGEAHSIRVNKTHARNMNNLKEGATTKIKNQRKGTQHTVKRVGKGFEHAAESSPDYNASAYDPLSESASPSGYDPVTFEAPKGKKTKAKKEMTYKQSHNAIVSTTIRTLMHDYDRTGKVGNSSPKNRGAALKQAIAIAYSKTNQTYKRSGKRLPSGVKRAEGEDSDYDALAYNPLGESATPSGYNPVTFGADTYISKKMRKKHFPYAAIPNWKKMNELKIAWKNPQNYFTPEMENAYYEDVEPTYRLTGTDDLPWDDFEKFVEMFSQAPRYASLREKKTIPLPPDGQ